MYDLACAINRLRNKQGTGHGRPWLPDLDQDEAKAAIELIGTISERMLSKLKQKKHNNMLGGIKLRRYIEWIKKM